MKTPLTAQERLDRVRHNCAAFRGKRLQPLAENDKTIAICGFGPSLVDTWQDTVKSDCVMTTSGAHDFLIGHGIVPTFHVECDPREHKTEFVRNPHPDVIYLINSQCHPSMFDVLRQMNVVMWHGYTDDDADNQISLVESLEPGARLMAGGTNVGMRSIPVAREMGYQRYDLHGMDCCYFGERQWAGDHLGHRHRTVKIDVAGKIFETSDLMMQSTDDFFNLMGMLRGCRFRVHGGGLLEERLKLYIQDPKAALTAAWWKPINFKLNKAPAFSGWNTLLA